MFDVSIIIPMYNAEKTIKNTIDSILQQTISFREIIVINDGSNDKSSEIVKSMNDNRIKLLEKENGGTSSAKNLGIKYAKGKYIMFVDSDDFIEVTYLQRHHEFIENCDFVCSGMCVEYLPRKTSRIINIESPLLGQVVDVKQLLYLLEMGELFNVDVAKVYSRDILLQNEILFDENLNAGEDLKFNSEYLRFVKTGILISYNGYHYLRSGQETLVSSYKNNMDIIVRESIESRKKIYSYYNLFEEEFFQNRFNNTTIDMFLSEIPNIYRKNCPLNAKEKTRILHEIRKEIKPIKNTMYSTKQSRIMYLITISVNALFANCLFFILFTMKARFINTYRRIFNV